METLICIFVIGVFLFIGLPLILFIAMVWMEKVLLPVFDFLADLVNL